MTQLPSSKSTSDDHSSPLPADKKLPANVRVMIGLVASPTLIIIAFSIYAVLFGNWSEPGISGIIFSSLGVFAYYVVFVGRLPRWFHFKQKNK